MANSNGLLPPAGLKGDQTGQIRRGKAFSLADLPNPIETEIRDITEIQKLHKDWKFVPYAGTMDNSGDALRMFLASMAYLSATHGACISSKKTISFGKMMVRRRQNEDFTFGVDEETPNAQALSYLEFAEAINMDGKSIKDLALEFHEDWEEQGDQFIEIVATTTLGVRTYSLFRHRPENCKYLATAKGEQRFIAISPIWKDAYLRKNPPDVLPLFPVFDDKGGTMRTIMHRRNGKNEWYGRPPAFGSWIFQYREYQDSSYLVKISNNNFTGQLIVEVEDDSPQQTEEDARKAGFASEADRIAANFTAQSDDPMTVWYMTRPFGSRAAFVHDIKPNTTQEFYKVMGEISERMIIRSHNWSKRLMEAEEAGGLSTNVFMDVLKSRLPVIANIQENAVALLNRAIQAISILDGKSDFQNLGVKFISPYQEIIDQMNAAGQEPQNKEETIPE